MREWEGGAGGKRLIQQTHPTHATLLYPAPYSNFCVQHILAFGRPEHRSVVMSTVRGHVLPFSLHKFSSNVVERCLEHGSPAEREAIVEEVLAPTLAIVVTTPTQTLPNEGSFVITPLQQLLRDPFGNYVAQKLLDVGSERQRVVMAELLSSYTTTLRRSLYGKHILARLEKMQAQGISKGGGSISAPRSPASSGFGGGSISAPRSPASSGPRDNGGGGWGGSFVGYGGSPPHGGWGGPGGSLSAGGGGHQRH